MRKTIFITVYDGDTEKVVLRSGVLERISAAGHFVVLLIRGSSRLEYYRESFGGPSISVELLPPATTTGEIIWHYVSWNTPPTHAAYLRRRLNWQKRRQTLLYLFESLVWTLGHFRLWRETLRLLYRLTPDAYAAELFDRYKPHLVFAPNMFSPEDCRILRAAVRRGIPTATTAKSWDVLTTKAFTRVKADLLLVFNECNKAEAIALGDYRPDAVVVTGFPQFDVYARKEGIVSREDFCRSIGANPAKRIVLMAVPGDWKTPHTKEIMRELSRRIDLGRFHKSIQILARFHPKYPDSSEKTPLPHFIYDRPGTLFSDKREFSVDMGVRDTFAWTFTDKDIAHLANSIWHADVIINTESTLTLDAAANGRPSILIGYDGDTVLPYWDSVERVYEREHYQQVLSTGAAPLVKSHDELEATINRFLDDPTYLAKERGVLVSKLLFSTDGRAAGRVADSVLQLLP